MTLLDAKEINPELARKQRRRMIVIIAVIVVVLAAGPIGFLMGHGWWFWYLPEEHRAGRFFTALQNKDFNAAYGIWWHDPDWRQHPERHASYPFGDFYRDWGPSGEWGVIKKQKVFGASTCPGGGSGVVVDVVVNDRAEHAQIWVEKSDKTLSYPPCELMFR